MTDQDTSAAAENSTSREDSAAPAPLPAPSPAPSRGSANDAPAQEYRVLARKYRPQNFDELIGQDALVRTLTNAIHSGRIAHAFMLTGVRGVGKTTTARLIARALNYRGPDGTAGPTTGATDDCETARAIAEDRHPDVMEMDAASRTGVDDIREILDGVRYAPTSARYKIYIIDEVHMLSKSAFNALLKTLEEPPAHVKFIFATTEIRKVPVTVLSRCQRFDLRRVEIDVLAAHFQRICGKETVTAQDEAIRLIAQAADGSVRDGLSLLDQAIALGNGTNISTDLVSTMLGLSDRIRIFDLFEATMAGDPVKAIGIMEDLHNLGADPLAVLQDLLDMTHAVTVLRTLEGKTNAGDKGAQADLNLALPHSALARARECASLIGLPALDRAWSILTKGAQDLYRAADARKALEMTLFRLMYASELPDPAKLLKKIMDGGASLPSGGSMTRDAGHQSGAPSGGAYHASAPMEVSSSMGGAPSYDAPPHEMAAYGDRGSSNLAAAPKPAIEYGLVTIPETLSQIMTLCEERGEMMLASNIYNYMHLVRLQKGRLEFQAAPNAPSDMAQKLAHCLNKWTDERWMVSLVTGGAGGAAGEKTLAQLDADRRNAIDNEVRAHPSVKKIISLFPAAEIERIYNPNE